MLRRAFNAYSLNARKRRAEILARHITLNPAWRVLDLGGGTGKHIHEIFPDHRNVLIADLRQDALEAARRDFGYETVEIDGSGRLPFGDEEFDLVFCSSVIEHVTGPKDDTIKINETRAFKATALRHQYGFAAEIRRVSKRYFVQTPHKYFVIESHSWLPGAIVFLNRPAQVRLLHAVAKSGVWPKTTDPDWHLLTPRDMHAMFPEAEIAIEHSMGLPKSIMAIKSTDRLAASH
jgi:SAM-dependent methyltransferase